MAKVRKGCAYRRLERPYTRHSKYKRASFVKAKPNIIVVKFDMGNASKDYEEKLELKVKESIQIRQNSIEAARQTCNRYLEKTLGKGNFHFRIRIYPHHILRENPLASGAGADRMSTGMKCSFGKVIGAAAQVKKGQTVLEVRYNKGQKLVAKEALRRASQKFSCSCQTVEV